MTSTSVIDLPRLRYPRSANEAANFVEQVIVVPGAERRFYEDALDEFVEEEEVIRQQEISDELWKKANIAKENLFQAIQDAQAKQARKKKDVRTSLDLSNCTWEQVMEEVQHTGQVWRMKSTGTFTGKTCLEKIGKYSDSFEAWLGLLPSDNYISSICGAFKLVIGAARQYEKIEDCVYEALSSIPEAMDMARRYIEIYKKHRDHRLNVRTFELYVAILEALTHIMRFFAESTFRQIMSSIAFQSKYKADIVSSVENVKKHAARISDEAQQCRDERLAKIDERTISMIQDSGDTKRMLRLIYNTLASNSMYNRRECIADASRVDKTNDTWTQNHRRLSRSLHYNKHLLPEDLHSYLQYGIRMDDEAKSLAAGMIQSNKFRSWLSEDAVSAALLVHGDVDFTTTDRFSPLGVVAAHIATLSDQPLHLNYFCSLHREKIGKLRTSSTVGMVGSLAGQLLSQIRVKGIKIDLSSLREPDLEKIEEDDPDAMLDVFRLLLLRLPASTVVICVLDEVNLYETGEQGSTTDMAVHRLLRVLEEAKNIVFKLLFTCQAKSLRFHKHFRRENILHLSERHGQDDSASWTIKQLSSARNV